MGDFIGAFAVYGYKKDPETRISFLLMSSSTGCGTIFRLRLQGMSNSGIAEKLNDMGVLILWNINALTE